MFFKPKSARASADFISRLKTAPVVQEAMRELELQDLSARQALIEEAAALRTSMRSFSEERSRRESAINAEIMEIEKRRNALGQELLDLDVAASRVRSSTERELGPLIAQIKAGADPRINNFYLWIQHAHDLAVEDAWKNSPQSKLYMVEGGTDALVSQARRLASASLDRLGCLVNDASARADAMRTEAALADDVLLELQSLAAAIHAEYESVPRSRPLPRNFLSDIPGVFVMEASDMREAASA